MVTSPVQKQNNEHGSLGMNAGKTFLIVDQDAHRALQFHNEFRNVVGDCQFVVVNDDFEARKYMAGEGEYRNRQEFPLPDVILLDVPAPRTGGLELLAWLRSLPDPKVQSISVVVFSRSEHPDDASRAYRLGANWYLISSPDWEKFRQQIRGLAAFWAPPSRA